MKRIKDFVSWFETFTDSPWYEWALAGLAGADSFVFVFPTDAMVFTSAYLSPRKWIRFSILTAIGSSLGSLILAYFAQKHGLQWINTQFPSLVSSSFWLQTQSLFQTYGLWVLFTVAVAPLIHHPALFLAVLSEHSLSAIFTVMVLGRVLKYGVLSALGRFAPQYAKSIMQRINT